MGSSTADAPAVRSIRRAKDAGLNAFPLQGSIPAVSIIALACDPLARSQGSAVARSPVRWWESRGCTRG